MSNVFLFGAGASCEYRGVYGCLFVDGTFFEALEEMWRTWFRSGEGIALVPWNPRGPVAPGGAQHYDGGRWRLPDLQAVLERLCGPNYSEAGLEATFSRVAEEGSPAELDLYVRAIELTIFHRLRALEPENVGVHLRFLRHSLQPGDAIITFNYDPILEVTLRYLSAARPVYWHEADGFRLELRELGPAGTPPSGHSNVEILKLHGSMNWLAPVGSPPRPPFRLLRILPNSLRGPGQVVHHDEDGRMLRPVIVPPLPDKDYAAMGLAALWDRAREVLAAAESLTVIGYRLPETDAAAHDLLLSAGRVNDRVRVVYVTREDSEAARRFAGVFPSARIELGGFRGYVDRVVGTA